MGSLQGANIVSPIIFQTERLIVRRYNADDKNHFFSLSGDEEVMRYIRPIQRRPDSDAFLDGIIAYYTTNPSRGRWAVEEKNSHLFVGSFAIIPIPGDEDKTQMGYSLLPGHWGKGYATELTLAALEYAFSDDQYEVIYGVTEQPNIASQKVLLKAGFKLSGTKIEGEKELLIYEVRKARLAESICLYNCVV